MGSRTMPSARLSGTIRWRFLARAAASIWPTSNSLPPSTARSCSNRTRCCAASARPCRRAADSCVFPTAVINVVGLTGALLGPDTPHLNALRADGAAAAVRAAFPAVTCTAQATYLTGRLPREHGIVGNGWYFPDLAQVMFWRQANQLVRGEKVWDTARRQDAACTCAQMFWWYNMYSSVNWSVTPRPLYPADGRKIPEIYSYPADLAHRLTAELGPFPFFDFWGPKAGLASSNWIAAASDAVDRWFAPTLLLVYLPHLDYDLQRYGVDDL